MYDIIPDIHGQAEKLKTALTGLGYRQKAGTWRHPDPERSCVFLGDFIDRGPENRDVIDIVRRMVDAGTARAIMGNHELNAIHFHTMNPETGAALRPHSEKNLRQHGSFLAEFPLDEPRTREVIDWMKSLPLFLELEGFRVVHACWNDSAIAALRAHAPGGILSEDQLIRAADKADVLYGPVETTTKGPELALPAGYTITDKDGTERREVRVKWWNPTPADWADIAISVPNLDELPAEALPPGIVADAYSPDARPVFFGHYWLDGTPELQAPNALCLDYSAGKDGPLVSYHLAEGASGITLENVSQHAGG